MALKVMNRLKLGPYISDAWQNAFDLVDIDPASAKWYDNGPDGRGNGLYGGLIDKVADEVIFDESDLHVISTKPTASNTVGPIDNRSGIQDPMTGTSKAEYSYEEEVTSTHSTTDMVGAGYSIAAEAGFEVPGGSAKVTTTYSFQYTHSWTEEQSKSRRKTSTVGQDVNWSVAKGKALLVRLMVDVAEVEIPYRARIYLEGISEANFPTSISSRNPKGAVGSDRRWTVDAGTLCKWIQDYQTADDESANFYQDPENPKRGFIEWKGTIKAKTGVRFYPVFEDVTQELNERDKQTAAKVAAIR